MDDLVNTDKAAQALTDFANGPAANAADLAADAFEAASDRIARSLEKAARTGQLSFRDMASSIAQDLAGLAIKELLIDPLTAAIGGIGSGGQSGGASPVNVVMNVTGASNPAAFQKSTSQISASLARAVAQGQKLF